LAGIALADRHTRRAKSVESGRCVVLNVLHAGIFSCMPI
jgi:hypothetical protein